MPTEHAHYWRIEEVNGREYSPGSCDCGESRVFKNYLDAALEGRGGGKLNEIVIEPRRQSWRVL